MTKSQVALVRQGKNTNIETLRGIAIIALVAFHVIGVTQIAGLKVPEGSSWRWFADSLSFIRMPLFTFLSGVVYATYAPMRTGVGRFIGAKSRRLLLPMISVGIIFLVVQEISPQTNRDLLSEQPWYTWLILPIAHFWFLPALFWIFALFALLDIRKLMEARGNLLLLLILSVTLSVGAGPLFSRNWLGLEGSIYLLPFFTLGVFCARRGWQNQSRRWKVLTLAILVLAFVWIQLGLSGLVSRVEERHDLIGIVASFAAVLAVFSVPFEVRWLAWMGQFAYPIFLFHVFGSAGSRLVLSRIGLDQLWLQFIVGVCCALGVGIVASLVLSRINFTNVVFLGNKPRKSRKRAQGRAG